MAKLMVAHKQYAITNVATTIRLTGRKCNITKIAGNLWANFLGATAVADANNVAFNPIVDLECANPVISFISDVTGATVQIIEWDD